MRQQVHESQAPQSAAADPAPGAASAPAPQQPVLRSNSVGFGSLLLNILAAVGSMPAFMGATPLVFAAMGAATPGVYLAAALMLLVFSAGYLAMSRKTRSASGFIVFIDHGLGRPAGMAAAYVTLVSYALLLAGFYASYSLFLQVAVRDLAGVNLPWIAGFLLSLPLILFMSYRRVEVGIAVIGTLVMAGMIAILALDWAILRSGSLAALDFAGLSPAGLATPAIGVALLVAVGCFGGVESAAVFSEEVRNPQRSIPLAMYAAIVLLGLFYVGSTLLLGNAIGTQAVQAAATEDPTGFILKLGGQLLGPAWARIAASLVVAVFFAALLGFSNMIHRYVFALGRAGILPVFVGRTHRRHGSPHTAGLATGLLVAIMLVALNLAGADAFRLYTWGVAIGTFGILLLMCVSSLAVAAAALRDGHDGFFGAVLAPAVSFLLYGALLLVALLNFGFLAGDGPVARRLWLVVVLAAAVGWLVGRQPRFAHVRLADPG